jgi:hypothetical protein
MISRHGSREQDRAATIATFDGYSAECGFIAGLFEMIDEYNLNKPGKISKNIFPFAPCSPPFVGSFFFHSAPVAGRHPRVLNCEFS